MNTKILNRDFQHPGDGYYNIEAKGYHPATMSDGTKIVQVIDDKAIRSIVNRFNAEAGAGALPHGNEMLIDHEHFKHDQDKETVAYGWGQQAAARADGVYLKNRWTGTGQPAVDKGDYRFFSSEYDPAEFEAVDGAEIPAEILNKFKGRKFVRPMRLDGLTLTNMPNNKGQKPITNRDPDGNIQHPRGEKDFAAPSGAADRQQQHTTTGNKMKTVCTLLGLSVEADEQSVHAAVSKILNRGEITPEALATLRGEHKTLSEQNKTLLGEQCEALMDAHGIKPDDRLRNRLKPILIGLTNREDRSAALVEFGYKLVEAGKPAAATQVKLHNRDGKQPGGTEQASGAGDGAAAATDTKVMNRAQEMRRETKTLSLATAIRMAQRELGVELI